jgi:protein involved in polysaccharide export with SLBB domain
MPSLTDLYAQVPTGGGRVGRFGSDIFLFGTGNASSLPMDLPVGPDYLLGVGDTLAINMWGGQSNRLDATIDRQGQIALPEAGPIMIDGLTIGQAQAAIQKALSTQFQNEHVEISLGRLRTIRVYVLGDVQRPGAYDISSLSTPLSALFAAAGPTAIGSLRILKQYRGDKLVREIDLYKLLLKGIRSDTERLLPGDVLFVPPAGVQVSIEGMVHHPAIYELTTEKTLSQVLDLAGGFSATASLQQIIVSRVIAHERHTMLNLPLSGDPAELTRQLAGFQVQGGDQVLITSILPVNKDAVYLQGHIYRPGTYPYKDGMTINDLVHSYQDVLPEPSDHAELVRLMPPDYHPQVTIFSLSEAMIGNDSFRLQPFDTVQIFGRYEVDSPGISITGDVLRPGDYLLSKGMTVGDLLRMAGGFARPAYRDEADLSSYEIQKGQRVLVKQTNVAVGKALDGDKSADVVLKPLDVLNIRRIAGWQDIGASVTINGEVEHAGSYGIEDGERLSSVLKRAGGFRADAYPPAAVLQRVQVRELNEEARQEMIQRIENTPIDFKPGTMTEQSAAATQQALQEERQQALTALRSHPATGRLVISISSTDIAKWENTPADIELRSGDTLFMPKRPDFVVVSGQVYNPIAIGHTQGERLGWYLRKAGGPTTSGDRKHIFVLRADGSVIPSGGGHGTIWMSDSFMNLRMLPGDTIFVPEKISGGSTVWQNIIGVAQIMSASMLPLAIGGIL